MSTLNEPKQALSSQQKMTSTIIDDLAKLLHARGFKNIDYGDTFIEAENLKLQVKIIIK